MISAFFLPVNLPFNLESVLDFRFETKTLHYQSPLLAYLMNHHAKFELYKKALLKAESFLYFESSKPKIS